MTGIRLCRRINRGIALANIICFHVINVDVVPDRTLGHIFKVNSIYWNRKKLSWDDYVREVPESETANFENEDFVNTWIQDWLKKIHENESAA